MFICGINIPTLLQGDSQAERVSGKVFDDDFMPCMIKSVKELNNYLKSYSTLMVANSQILINPGHKIMLNHSYSGLETSTLF